MYNGQAVIGIWDFILAPFVFFLIYIYSSRAIRTKAEELPYYEFYLKGLWIRLGSCVFFCLIYVYYYGSGDTINYWGSGCILNKMITKDLGVYFDIMMGDLKWANYATFDITTGHPEYMLRDKQAFAVVRYVSPFCLITIHSYVACTLLVAFVTYSGVWRLFVIFNELFPKLRRQFAYTILFVPSVSFWGGGILKDTFSLWGACLFFYGFYMLFFKGGNRFKYLFLVVCGSFLMLTLKPYIFQVLMPSCIIWYFTNRLKGVESGFGRALLAPILLGLGVIVVSLIMNQVSGSLGDYANVNTAVEKAKVTQTDLKRAEYGGNSFDIGTFDGSAGGAIRMFPKAVFAGLFRPTILDVRNPVMFISAMENLFLLYIFLQTIFRVGLSSFFSKIYREPLLMATITFSVLMAFAVGLTTSNFGSLVRYRIPLVPFFFPALYVIRYLKEKEDFENENPGLVYETAQPPIGEEKST